MSTAAFPSEGASPGTVASLGASSNSRSKLWPILHAATVRFGRDGFDATKWAEVATDVGIGPTALYHYFESKTHCLFVLLTVSMQQTHERFIQAIEADGSTQDKLQRALAGTFALSDDEVLRSRIVVSEQGRLANRSSSAREEAARVEARHWVRAIETDWSTFLEQAVHDGTIPKADPQLLTRAVLGFLSSVWHWYRPEGSMSLESVSEFIVDRTLRMLQ